MSPHVVQRDGYRLIVGGPVPSQAAAITLGSTIIVRSEWAHRDGLIAHELVHVRQFGELGWLRFLARYVRSYLRLRLSGFGHLAAYRRIPLEVEASWLSRLHDRSTLEPGSSEPLTEAVPVAQARAPWSVSASRSPRRAGRSPRPAGLSSVFDPPRRRQDAASSVAEARELS